jgi:tRNA(Ile)-lysidine synthase TilS/MesJ
MGMPFQFKSRWTADATNNAVEALARHIRRDVMQNICRRWWSELCSRQVFCEQFLLKRLNHGGPVALTSSSIIGASSRAKLRRV